MNAETMPLTAGGSAVRPPDALPPSCCFCPRTIAWFLCLFVASLLCFSWTVLPNSPASFFLKIVLFVLLGLTGLGLLFLFPDTQPRRAIFLLFFAALLLRFLLIFAPASDDIHRYRWEGRLVLAGENPYATTADSPLRVDFQDTDWQQMNHRERLTAYPPGIQWIFASTVALTSHPLGMKCLALAGDLATLVVLLLLLKQRQLPLRWSAVYAFNPVILISYAAEAHFDSLMVAALLAALLAAGRQQSARAWLWLGVAIQIKIICLLVVPFFFTRGLRSLAWILLPVLILPALPFSAHFSNFLSGVSGFATSGIFNAPLVSFFLTVFSPITATRLAGFSFLLLFVLVLRARWHRRVDLSTAVGLVLGAFICCSPIVHFWYLAWLLPFAALRPSFAIAVLSITMAAYFAASWNAAQGYGWGYGPMLTALIWLPAAFAGLLQYRHFRGLGSPLLTTSCGVSSPRLGLIIPTLNPGDSLATLLHELHREAGLDVPIVLADATPVLPQGSLVCALPRWHGTIVIPCARGRGQQIARGIQALPTACDWILIAHADTTPRPGWRAHLESAIISHPEVSLFVFGQRFMPSSPRTLVIEILNEVRVLYGGVAFGDQTMVIRRDHLVAAGGFPVQPLMEDVEVSLRLASRGRIHYLAWEWQVSAGKWRGPVLRRAAFIIRLLGLYFLARRQGPEAASIMANQLYAQYYPEP